MLVKHATAMERLKEDKRVAQISLDKAMLE